MRKGLSSCKSAVLFKKRNDDMTIASDVKSCIASLNGAKNNFSQLALKAVDEKAQKEFHECMMETEEIINDLQKRLVILEREEPQYKN